LQGGEKPSEQAADHWLKVRKDQNSKEADRLNVTVLWVDISATKYSPDAEMYAATVYDGEAAIFLGSPYLGAERAGKDAKGLNNPVNWCVGVIQMVGAVHPPDLNDKFTFNAQTVGFVDPVIDEKKPDNDKPAKAKFGFIFRRFATTKTYFNGENLYSKTDHHTDDSLRLEDKIQDPIPAKDGKKLVIVDIDSPGAAVSLAEREKEKITEHPRYERGYRGNFREHVLFNWTPYAPERASDLLRFAVSLDMVLGRTFDKDGEPILGANFVRAKNNSANFNYVKALGPKDLDIGMELDLAKPTIASAVTKYGKDGKDAKDGKGIKRKKSTLITIKCDEGGQLLGDIFLGKPSPDKKKATAILPTEVTFETTENNDAKRVYFSNQRVVRAWFEVDEPVGTELDLVIRTNAGIAAERKFVVID
jgi:hypothetical protein